MRAYRKRPWAQLAVNMTPLIDVVFLIIIFFIIMINFSEMHIRNIKLPKADEAKKSLVEQKSRLSITVRSKDMIFLGREKIQVRNLSAILKKSRMHPRNTTVQIRADENVRYVVIKEIMLKLALADINKIEFSTWEDPPEPLEKDSGQ